MSLLLLSVLSCGRSGPPTELPAHAPELSTGASVDAPGEELRSVASNDQGCLPEWMHGPFRARRGAWRLYAAVSGDALLLEHQGPSLRISEREVSGLRSRVKSIDPPIHAFGYGVCDNLIHPRRGMCLFASILPDTDPFIIAEHLDSTLANDGAAACYGVVVLIANEPAVAW